MLTRYRERSDGAANCVCAYQQHKQQLIQMALNALCCLEMAFSPSLINDVAQHLHGLANELVCSCQDAKRHPLFHATNTGFGLAQHHYVLSTWVERGPHDVAHSGSIIIAGGAAACVTVCHCEAAAAGDKSPIAG